MSEEQTNRRATFKDVGLASLAFIATYGVMHEVSSVFSLCCRAVCALRLALALVLALSLFVAPIRAQASTSQQTNTSSISEQAISYNSSIFLHSSNASEPEMSREKMLCSAKFGSRKLIPTSYRYNPPLLYTYPGSGNTWTRLLIEYATGTYTGSVYTDKTLTVALPGEIRCSRLVSAVKAHPHTHEWKGLFIGKYSSSNHKCRRQGNIRFNRAVLLLRDPFDSIWSEYQRRITQSHVEGITKQKFDWPRWEANIAAMSHSYREMWTREYEGIKNDLPTDDYIFVKYEDLKNPSTRHDILHKILQFLRIPNVNVADDRLSCAFSLAENRHAHRSVNSSESMSKREAYRPELVCRMWAVFGEQAQRAGYAPFNNISCNSTVYLPLPKVLVGPKGELNVSKSQKPVNNFRWKQNTILLQRERQGEHGRFPHQNERITEREKKQHLPIGNNIEIARNELRRHSHIENGKEWARKAERDWRGELRRNFVIEKTKSKRPVAHQGAKQSADSAKLILSTL